MRQYDKHNHLVLSRIDFIRSLDQLRCNLLPAEVDTITKVYQAPSKYVLMSKIIANYKDAGKKYQYIFICKNTKQILFCVIFITYCSFLYKNYLNN